LIDRILTLAMVSAAALSAVACAPAQDAQDTATGAGAPASVDAESADTDASALPVVGQSYWAARRQLLAAGYEPLVIDGSVPFTVCVAEMEAGEPLAGECTGETLDLPEVEGCAGTGMGNCRTNWRHPGTGRQLSVSTIGEPQPGEVSDVAWDNGTALAAISTEDACRQAVQAQFGQEGPAVTFIDGVISWRAPVDGGRLSFTCAVNGHQVSLTREGETQVVTLNTAADSSAQQEAH
jgi:hypothetical protein